MKPHFNSSFFVIVLVIFVLEFEHIGRNPRFDRVLANEEDVLLEDVLICRRPILT